MQPKHFYDVPLTEVYCKIKLCVSILVYVSVNGSAYSYFWKWGSKLQKLFLAHFVLKVED